ncbi:hypothetical protein CICLE_v10006750mg [Citrus x clementina]|uniref:Reverse transcriptase RNase H-like domain-containing protein n=1 Tax=Citrus clementina TaxID=85681 RepID=V4U504_CITCL|nr:hypothetical protein CICLE_v10006750mg [Citrus x clementina]
MSGPVKKMLISGGVQNYEILGVINTLNSFRLFLNQSFMVRTYCEAIMRFHNKTNDKKLSSKTWLNFINTILGNGYKVEFEHIKRVDNRLTYY